MSLIATARALDDQRFLWRVRAATMNLAITKYTSVEAKDKALAQEIMDKPMTPQPTMEALVASHAPIAAAIITDISNTVSTEGVTDEQIIAAVTIYWGPVATRRAEIRATEAAAKV